MFLFIPATCIRVSVRWRGFIETVLDQLYCLLRTVSVQALVNSSCALTFCRPTVRASNSFLLARDLRIPMSPTDQWSPLHPGEAARLQSGIGHHPIGYAISSILFLMPSNGFARQMKLEWFGNSDCDFGACSIDG